jgi:Ribbon-helix-helix protein, copG family
VKRTQLYLDDDSWNALHARATLLETTVSELVRRAIREQYLSKLEGRRQAMEAFVGSWKDRSDIPDAVEYVRKLRRDNRLERVWQEGRKKR